MITGLRAAESDEVASKNRDVEVVRHKTSSWFKKSLTVIVRYSQKSMLIAVSQPVVIDRELVGDPQLGDTTLG